MLMKLRKYYIPGRKVRIYKLMENEIHPSESQSEKESDALKTRQTQLAEKEQLIQALTAELKQIKSSKAWSIIQFLCRIRLILFPHGSRRERVAHELLNRIRGWRTQGFRIRFPSSDDNAVLHKDKNVNSGNLLWHRAPSEQDNNSMRLNMWSIFEEELSRIDSLIGSVQSCEIPRLFAKIPLDVFGKLLLDVPSQYHNIKAFFPTMSSEQVQRNWTGAHGEELLAQSLAFVKTMIYGFGALTGKKIEEASVLDYGCGWGRLIRPLYKFISFEKIYAVDPWDESIKECEEHHLKANIALSDYVPRSLPFELKFDLIYAFSVFTHLSEKTANIVLKMLRKYILEDGLLIITIRPKEYWYVHDKGVLAPQMIKIHDEEGFAFTPHNRAPVDGDVTYGDTSMTLAYFESHFPQWKIESVECNDVDSGQVILFIKPV